MSKFKPTHRVLVKATEANHSYEVISIDVNSGMFKKDLVKQQLTKIRVNDEILAEVLPFNSGSKGLSNKESLAVILDFNAKRVELGFNVLKFERLTDVNK